MGIRFVVVLAVAGVFALCATSALALTESGGTPAPSEASESGGAEPRKKKRVKLPKILKKIAQCESGGNPRAISPDGRYRGKYQFSRSTWRAMGGKGDPAKASEYKQDKLALKLYRAEGTRPWPYCGEWAKRQV
jgi:Transglycosylase-like domain